MGPMVWLHSHLLNLKKGPFNFNVKQPMFWLQSVAMLLKEMGPLPEEFGNVDSRNHDAQCLHFFLLQILVTWLSNVNDKGLRLRKVYQIPWGRQFGGLFSMLESWFFRLFRGFLCIFRDETLFSKVFPVLSAFSIRQNMFPSQKSGKGNGNLYWQIVILPKAIETWFQHRLWLHYACWL